MTVGGVFDGVWVLVGWGSEGKVVWGKGEKKCESEELRGRVRKRKGEDWCSIFS